MAENICHDKAKFADNVIQMRPDTEIRGTDWKAIFEQRRKKNWRFLSSKVLYDPRFMKLSGSTRKVYLYALEQVRWSKTSKKNGSRPDPDVMLPIAALEAFGVSRSQRRKAIKELTGVGLLERVPKRTDTRNSSKVYRCMLI